MRKQVFKYFKKELKDMTNKLFEEIRCLLTRNIPSWEEDKGNKVGESHSHTENFLTHLDTKTLDQSSLQDIYHWGFNSRLRNHFIPKINMRKFDGNDP